MKNLTLLLILFLSFAVIGHAQYIDVNDIYFTTAPSNQTKLTDSSLEKGATVTLWFDFQNNLNNQTLQAGDSITFGWSINGVDQGIITFGSLNSTVQTGATVNGFLRQSYPLPNAYDSSFTICAWPLYNPYNSNTDPMNGRGCNDFKTEEDPNQGGNPDDSTTTGTFEIGKVGAQQLSVANHTILYRFENSSTVGLEMIDLSGNTVISEQVNESGRIQISGDTPKGFYLIRATSEEGVMVKKVYLD